MPDVVTALLGALVGGGLTALTTWLLDARREGVQRRAELMRVRREVELEAMNAAMATAREFSHALKLHDAGKSWAIRKEMKETFEALIDRNGELEIVALRVDALASRELAHQVLLLRGCIQHWMSEGAERKWTAATVQEAMGDTEQIMAAMTEIVRRDLGTAELDG